MSADVTVGIPTKNRYDTLVQTLQSVAFQTLKPKHVIIVDDSDTPIDIRNLPAYQAVLGLFNEFGITWEVVFGSKRGQHISHQFIQEKADTDWIWRIDDDEIAEPNVLRQLFDSLESELYEQIGAIGGLVIVPPVQLCPVDVGNVISDLMRPNIQWFKSTKEDCLIPVEHLTSSFLYRRGIAKYETGLSPAAHREETMFTYEIHRTGYDVLVNTSAVTWHLRNGTGGIRSHQDSRFWEQDEKLFHVKLKEWGINSEPTKLCVLDCGKGDHVIFKKLIPDLIKKYGKVVLATCFPDVFDGDPVEQISIADAQMRTPIDHYNIYKFCIDHQWKESLEGAFRLMYGI